MRVFVTGAIRFRRPGADAITWKCCTTWTSGRASSQREPSRLSREVVEMLGFVRTIGGAVKRNSV
jgi:hypothetical protein